MDSYKREEQKLILALKQQSLGTHEEGRTDLGVHLCVCKGWENEALMRRKVLTL